MAHVGRGRSRWVLLGAVVALVAVACGSSSKPQAETAKTDPSAILKVGLDLVSQGGVTFDPVRTPALMQPHMQMMYDTMVRFAPEGLKPGLATAWKFPDDKTVVLTLRTGVKFQDGTPFNADAVKFSWDRLIATNANPPQTRIGAVKALQSVEITGTNEVTVRLSTALAGDWRDRLLFDPVMAIVSPTAVQKLGASFADAPVNAGAGPYAFVSQTPGQRIVLRKWDGYWDPSGQKLGGVDFIQVATGAARVTAMLSGTIDMTNVTATDVNALTAQGFVVEKVDSTFRASPFIQICTERAPFNTLAARKALAEAINRQDIVTAAYQGFAKVTSVLPPLGSVLSSEATKLKDPYPFDATKAKADLAAAGVAAGTKITWQAQTSPLSDAIAQALQSQLKVVGLTLEIIPSTNSFADNVKTKPDFGLGGASISSIKEYLLPTGVINYCKYNNEKVTAAINGILDVTKDQTARVAAWTELQKQVYDDVPLIVLASPFIPVVHSKKVVGVSGDPGEGNPDVWRTIAVEK